MLSVVKIMKIQENRTSQTDISAPVSYTHLEFAGLGFDDHIFLSAAHGRGFSELASRLDGFLKQKGAPLKEELEEEPENGEETALPIKVAVVGRPNAGKSSLVNAILRDRRTIVSNVAGTTRDAIDIPYPVSYTHLDVYKRQQ